MIAGCRILAALPHLDAAGALLLSVLGLSSLQGGMWERLQ
jgi:hypothetical protein